MKKIYILFSCLLLLFGISPLFSVSAAEQALTFSVEPILPENQDQGIEHYISVTPNEQSLQQDFSFVIKNETNQPQTIHVDVLNAYTSANGVIQYTNKETEDSQILDSNYEMKKYVQAPNKVELGAGETKEIQVKVNIPDMEGTILGAISFQNTEDTSQSKTKGISLNVLNEVKVIYGLAFHFPTQQQSQFDVGNAYLEPMANYYAVRLPVSLKQPLLLENITLDYEVDYQGKTLFSSQEDINFAPMSKTNLSIPFDYKNIKVNEPYQIKAQLTYKENGEVKTTTYESTFLYKGKKHQVVNNGMQKRSTPEEVNHSFKLLIMMFIVAIPIFIALILIYKQRKEDQRNINSSNDSKITI